MPPARNLAGAEQIPEPARLGLAIERAVNEGHCADGIQCAEPAKTVPAQWRFWSMGTGTGNPASFVYWAILFEVS